MNLTVLCPEDAVSPSTARLMVAAVQSFDVLGPSSVPVEALAAVHYFASTIEKPQASIMQCTLSLPIT